MLKSISASICFLALLGCQPSFEKDYKPSGVPAGQKMVFPAGAATVAKAYREFSTDVPPSRYQHPNKWVIYMAAPGWTNGDRNIVTRLSLDRSLVQHVTEFIHRNKLSDSVSVAWLQYDLNPGSEFVEAEISQNFIPYFLQAGMPRVNHYIYSPAGRFSAPAGQLRYDEWLKPYLFHTVVVDGKYRTNSQYHEEKGYYDFKSDHWDNWGRHWFVVNPDGVVVDAYISNTAQTYTYGPYTAVRSLVHHMGLSAGDVKMPPAVRESYQSSKYSMPYWEKVREDAARNLGMAR